MIQAAFGLCFCSGIACGYIAKKKRRSFRMWGALDFFIMGPLVLVLISCIAGAIASFISR